MCDISASLHGKVAIVTGGNSGMGYETAKILAKQGAKVIIAGRNETRSMQAVRTITDLTGNSDVLYRKLDLGSLKSVRGFVGETYNLVNKLDILINNAGAIALPDSLTEDGLHVMMQVNYFGAFLLTYLLIPLLKSSAPSRIINVSAASMYVGSADFDHWNDVGRWSSINLLANSKLAVSLFTVELDKKLANTGITANSMDPFLINNTDALRNLPTSLKNIAGIALQIFGKPPEQAGMELAHLAISSKLNGVSGRHFKSCVEFFNTWLANDGELTSELWEISKTLVQLRPEEYWDV